MDEMKQNLPLENTLRFDSPDSVDATTSVTEEDVVVALTQAEETLPTAENSLVSEVVEERIITEEEEIIASITAKRTDHVQQFKVDFS